MKNKINLAIFRLIHITIAKFILVQKMYTDRNLIHINILKDICRFRYIVSRSDRNTYSYRCNINFLYFVIIKSSFHLVLPYFNNFVCRFFQYL